MKFKSIFFLFNIVVLISFSLIFLLPLILLSGNYSSIFWIENWYLALMFFLMIVVLDGYFILNWKLFIYLEKEDWNNLTLYLEEKIYKKGQFRKQYIRLMINTSLAVSNLDKIDRLAKEIDERKPALFSQYALLLGIPLFLRNNTEDALTYYGKYKDINETKDISWIKWVFAYSLIRDKNTKESELILLNLLDKNIDDVLMILVLYTLNSIKTESISISKNLNEHKMKYSDEKKWNLKVEKLRNKNIFILLVTGLLEEARKWERDI